MNSNIVKIGKALKWRGVYDDSKKYYAENIITCYGGVFRCNVPVAQGIPPYELNEDGLPTIQNSETWTCLVDTTWIIEWVLAFKKFKDETLERFTKDEQHIEEHCKKLEEHQKDIEGLGTSVSELVERDKGHDLLIKNLTRTVGSVSDKANKNEKDIETINKKISDSDLTLGELQKQIAETNNRIDNEVSTLQKIVEQQSETIKENSEKIERLNNQIAAMQEQLELISRYNSCFSGGIWDNDLYWNNDSLWNNGYSGGDSGEGIQTELSALGYDEETGTLTISGSVISYDESTGTLSIIDETNYYDAATGTLHIDADISGTGTEVSAIGYDEETGTLSVSGSILGYSDNTGTLSVIDETNIYDEKTGTLCIDGFI